MEATKKTQAPPGLCHDCQKPGHWNKAGVDDIKLPGGSVLLQQ